MTTKFKKGDKVVIIPSKTHSDEIKKHYNQVLEIEHILSENRINPLYKISGIPDYGLESDLQHVAIHFMTDDILFDIIDRAAYAIENVNIKDKEADWIRDYIIDTSFSEN